MKKLLLSFICMLLLIMGGIPIQAEETVVLDGQYTETFTLNNKTYEVTIEGNESLVRVLDGDNVTVIEYDGDNKTLFINGEDCSDQVHFEAMNTIPGPKRVLGVTSPMRYYFDVNPSSVSEIVGAVIAVAAVTSAVLTSGLTVATFSAGIDYYFAASKTGGLLSKFYPYASVNGFYQFAQKYNDTQRQNINRSLYIRVGYDTAYKIYGFGNGGWFDTVKP